MIALIFASKILMMLGMAAFLTIDSLNMILSTISSRGLEMMLTLIGLISPILGSLGV